MTALEKAARALCLSYLEHDYEHEDALGRVENDWRDWLPEARAVLMAVREVDMATGWVGAGIIQGPVGGSAYTAATDCFAGMIDAILNEETK